MRLDTTLVTLFAYIMGCAFWVHQEYFLYQTRRHMDQTIGGYLIYLDGEINEEMNRQKGFQNQTYIENLIPVEFKHRLEELDKTTSFQLELGFGNNYIFDEIPEFRHSLNHAGTTIALNSHDDAEYKTIIKLLAGAFDTEMEKALFNYNKFSDIEGKPFIYHNNGENPMNFIMMRKIVEFFKENECFALFSMLDVMKSFEADYISFSLGVELSPERIVLKVKTAIYMREFLVHQLFSPITYNAPKGSSPIIINTDKKVVIDSSDYISSSQLSRYMKDSYPLYALIGNQIQPSRSLQMENYIIKPFSSMNNRLIHKLKNLSFNDKMTIRLFINFSHREMPILSKSTINCPKNKCAIKEKRLMKAPIVGIHSIPAHTLLYDIELDVYAEIEIDVYYEFVPENFEALTSNYNIYYVIPASFVQFKVGSDATVYERRFNNIAYKGKAYDSTSVFSIISIYIVIIFAMFNALISLTDTKKDDK